MSLRRNMLWMAASQGSAFVVQFGSTVVIARLLSPYEMGVFAAALAVLGLLAVIRGFSLGNYVIRATALTPALLDTAFTINALLVMLVGAAVVMLSLLGGVVLDDSGVRQVLMPIALAPVLSLFEFRPATVMERQGQFGALAVLNLVRILVGNGLAIGLAYEGYSYMSLAYGQLAGSLVAAVGFSVLGWRHVSLRIGLADWRPILRYGWHMLAISGASAAATRLAELALARMMGLVALGMYSRATGLANVAWEHINMVISRALFVDLAEQHRQGRSLRYSYLRVVTLSTAVFWPAFVGLAVLAGPLLMLLYGPKWMDAQLPLSLLALSMVPAATMLAAGGVLVVTERTAEQMRLETIRSAVGLLLFLAGCMVGLAWVAAARLLESILAYVLYRRPVQQMTQTRERDFLPIYLRSAGLTVAAVAPSFLLMAWHDWSPEAPLGPIGLSVLAGIVLWSLALYLMGHILVQEARTLLGQLNQRLAARRSR